MISLSYYISALWPSAAAQSLERIAALRGVEAVETVEAVEAEAVERSQGSDEEGL